MKNNKGITLIALAIMVIIIIMLATITTTTGLNVIKESRYNKAVAELKIMQAKVNELYGEYKNVGTVSLPAEVNGIDISNVSNEDIIDEIEESYNSVYNKSFTKTEIKADGFRFYSSDYIKNTLDVDGVNGDFIININTRTVIYIEGMEKDGIVYYALNQIEGEQYNVQYNEI